MAVELKNVVRLPVVDEYQRELDALEADFAVASVRVAQAVEKRDAIAEAMRAPVRQREVAKLQKRGIELGKTVVIVSERNWNNEWVYKRAIVMDVNVDLDINWDEGDRQVTASYDIVPAKKDGTPSKASLGMFNPTIERIAD